MKILKIGTAVIVAAGAALFVANTAMGGSGKIAYPDGYRAWTHVKSMVILPGHSLENPFRGIHHVYANEAAVKGLSGGKYPDGARFVFDLLEETSGGNALTEGKRKLTAVMVKSVKAYAGTGGWGFQAWDKDSRTKTLVNDAAGQCFGCHEGVKDTAYVFSKMRK